MPANLIKIFLPAVLAFAIGVVITPLFTHFFYKYRLWKRTPRKEDVDLPASEEISEHFKKIHNGEEELKTPRPGGMIIWVSILATTLLIYLISKLFPNVATIKLDFLSRSQTWLPLFALFAGAIIGLTDDFLTIFVRKGVFRNGFPRSWMVVIVSAVGLTAGLWFFNKLGVTSIHIPFNGDWQLGTWIVPLFVLVFLGTYSSGVIDGIDGLAGGVLASAFAAFGTIAYFQDQLDLAALSAAIVGALLAFLWFNIPPARFYLGETGMMALVFALPIIAFLTDQVLLLPIIGILLVTTSLSSLIQITAKKIWGRERGKIFRVAPLHHHFEVLGWSRAKIVMRYWVVSVVAAVIGVIIALIS
ncbi:MAG TPA: hypothetical protein VJ103_02235 [Candidatus Paceibacterota bacterium]|nr:hypothetical protein [Candidatus Paceibacterota bacterium]